MSIVGIVFLSVFPCLLIMGFIVFGFIGHKYVVNYRMSHSGVGFYSYDPFTRKAKTIKSAITVKSLLIHRKKLTKIDEMISEFQSDENIESIFRIALNDVSNRKENVLFQFRGDFKRIKKKKNRFVFNVSFDLIEGSSDYIINIVWRTVKEKKVYVSNNILLGKDDIVSEQPQPKAFIAFNLRSSITDPVNQLLKLINVTLNKNVKYIVNNQTLILIIEGKNVEQVNKYADKTVSKLKSKGARLGMRSIFEGSAHISIDHIKTNRDVIKVIRVLDFLIILSIDKSIDFISNRDKNFDVKKYENFSKGQKMFRDSLKTDSVVSEMSPIKRWGKKKKIIDFASPNIHEMNDLMLNKILANGNNLDDLIDNHAKIFAIKKMATEPVMIDVNKEWLVRNKDKITNMKVIYSIRIKNHIDYNEISSIAGDLRKKGFIFSLNISLFLASTSILISKIKPEFIVINGGVWKGGMSSPALFASLLGLRKIANESGIKLIYENPDLIVDDVMAQKLGIEYSYNTKR
ncbi:MAG: hypothetical protein KAG14_04060 [Mycoplasmataceae bacterium]|nr:hypothetical protein [Mycoplasmataceae bacterium]